jgi:prevent-host-death family protein
VLTTDGGAGVAATASSIAATAITRSTGVAAYCAATDRCYVLPHELSVERAAVHLRLAAARTSQQSGIHRARDFELGATLARLRGPIAQLGERLSGTQKVAGSSPASSMVDDSAVTIGAHEFRERFGWWIERAAAGERIEVTRHGKPFVRVLAAGP